MKTLKLPAIVFVCASLLQSCQVFAQTEKSVKDSETTPTVQNPNIAAFRDLICSYAADFRGKHGMDAVQLVEKHQFVDERFNASIYLLVREAMKPEIWNDSTAEYALRLMPFCTLDQHIRVKLVVESFIKCEDHLRIQKENKQRYSTKMRKQLLTYLQQYPNVLGKVLKEQMEHDDYPTALIELAEHGGSSREELLPKVLAAARSEDPERVTKALFVASALVAQIAQEAARPDIKPDLAVPSKVEDKHLAYAYRIVARYDKNRDGVLGKDETQTMLTNPQAADTNFDEFISERELAIWFQTKSGR